MSTANKASVMLVSHDPVILAKMAEGSIEDAVAFADSIKGNKVKVEDSEISITTLTKENRSKSFDGCVLDEGSDYIIEAAGLAEKDGDFERAIQLYVVMGNTFYVSAADAARKFGDAERASEFTDLAIKAYIRIGWSDQAAVAAEMNNQPEIAAQLRKDSLSNCRMLGQYAQAADLADKLEGKEAEAEAYRTLEYYTHSGKRIGTVEIKHAHELLDSVLPEGLKGIDREMEHRTLDFALLDAILHAGNLESTERVLAHRTLDAIIKLEVDNNNRTDDEIETLHRSLDLSMDRHLKKADLKWKLD